ncbi:hypothetical protein D3C84_998290 [compost metagenome]
MLAMNESGMQDRRLNIRSRRRITARAGSSWKWMRQVRYRWRSGSWFLCAICAACRHRLRKSRTSMRGATITCLLRCLMTIPYYSQWKRCGPFTRMRCMLSAAWRQRLYSWRKAMGRILEQQGKQLIQLSCLRLFIMRLREFR